MEEKDWLILKMLHQKRNMTKTAEQLYTSQPALTYRIQQLEKEFGTRIVTRGRKGVEFTAQGEELVKYAENMLHELRKTKELVQNMNDKVAGTLRLGVSGSFARYRLPLLLKQFVDSYPGVEIHVKTGWSSEILGYVQKEDVHIGILRGDHHWTESSIHLAREPFCLVSKNRIDIDSLPGLPRIHYKINDSHLRHTIEKWWLSKFSRPPLITMEVDSVETCVELVNTGLGYAFVPGISLQKQDSLFVLNLQAEDHTPIVRDTWLIYRDVSLQLSAVSAFVDFIRKTSIGGHSKKTDLSP